MGLGPQALEGFQAGRLDRPGEDVTELDAAGLEPVRASWRIGPVETARRNPGGKIRVGELGEVELQEVAGAPGSGWGWYACSSLLGWRVDLIPVQSCDSGERHANRLILNTYTSTEPPRKIGSGFGRRGWPECLTLFRVPRIDYVVDSVLADRGY